MWNVVEKESKHCDRESEREEEGDKIRKEWLEGAQLRKRAGVVNARERGSFLYSREQLWIDSMEERRRI